MKYIRSSVNSVFGIIHQDINRVTNVYSVDSVSLRVNERVSMYVCVERTSSRPPGQGLRCEMSQTGRSDLHVPTKVVEYSTESEVKEGLHDSQCGHGPSEDK